MKRYLTLIIFTLIILSGGAFQAEASKHGKDGSPSRKEWVKEMRSAKQKYIKSELKLSDDQATKFFPIYFAMEEEIMELQHQARKMEKQIDSKEKKTSPTDEERALEMIYSLKSREGAVELKYLPKFKEILTARQLLKLKHIERKFTRDLMKHRKK